MGFPKTVDRAEVVSRSFGDGTPTKLFIEEIGYQGALIQTLNRNGIPSKGAKVRGQVKRARLSLTTHLIQSGKILFPRKGCEELVQQLVEFGVEKHDDLADTFAILILKVMERDVSPPRIIFFGPDEPSDHKHAWKPLSRLDDLRSF